jgi:uncharacterized membrane protein YvlD (DUF360 family)
MRAFVVRWVGGAVILLIVAQAVGELNGQDTFQVTGLPAALVAVVVLSIFNLVLHPLVEVVKTVGCLVNLLTLGLFGGLVSFAFWTVAFYVIGDFAEVVPGFVVKGWRAAAIGAFWMSVGNALLTAALGHSERDDERRRRRRD